MSIPAIVTGILVLAAILVAVRRGEWRPFIIGAVLLYAASFILKMGLGQEQLWYESAHWQSTPATVLESTKQKTTRKVKSGDSYRTEVRYHFKVAYDYTVDGVAYLGDRFTVGMYDSSEAAVDQYLLEYPVGKSITVLYDPANPAESAITRGNASASWLLYAIALLPALVGGAFIFRTIQNGGPGGDVEFKK